MNWFWWFLIISFVVCFIINNICAEATTNKIKRDDPLWYAQYKSSHKKTFSERFINLIRSIIFAVIPFVSIIITLTLIFTCTNEQVVRSTKQKLEK